MKTILFLALIGTVSTVLVLNRPRPEERAIEIVARASASETPAATSVALQSTDDIKLAADIRTALLKDARVAPVSDRVTIVVRGGVVTLQGKVETREQRSIVEDDTRAVPGVERIDDLIVTRE
jgi:osmotically-inducible protein OsmY